MLIIENFLASIGKPEEKQGIDLENNYIEDEWAQRLYEFFRRRGNALFDTYGMWHDLDGLRLINCLLNHFAEKEEYRKCQCLKKRKEVYIRLVGYFDRCRREKVERIKKKRKSN